MKGYYMTYGVFTNELEPIVKDLEQELDILLVKQDDRDEVDNELYFLDLSLKNIITNFSIIKSLQSYHFAENEILTPNYLISCNVTSNKDEKIKEQYVQFIRKVLRKKDYLLELNFDIDEW